MKILIASDKFKGSLTALEVCQNVQKGIREVIPEAEVTMLPMADGGEGSLDVLLDALALDYQEIAVRDPLFRMIKAGYGRKGSTAFIEMAGSSGLELLTHEERNALKTSSIGVGELMHHALKHGTRHIYLFVGGSATNDGGMGMLQGLGFRFENEAGEELPGTGGSLQKVDRIIRPTELPEFDLTIVTDVQNKLLGPEGATYHYGGQKGADVNNKIVLEKGLEHFSRLIGDMAGLDVADIPGSGAAGGIAVAGVGLLQANLQKGIDTFLQITNFHEHLKDADLVITGEGKLDTQTLQGKVVHGVAKAAASMQKEIVVVCGVSEVLPSDLDSLGIKQVLSLKTQSVSVAYCIAHASDLIQERIIAYFRESKTF